MYLAASDVLILKPRDTLRFTCIVMDNNNSDNLFLFIHILVTYILDIVVWLYNSNGRLWGLTTVYNKGMLKLEASFFVPMNNFLQKPQRCAEKQPNNTTSKVFNNRTNSRVLTISTLLLSVCWRPLPDISILRHPQISTAEGKVGISRILHITHLGAVSVF